MATFTKVLGYNADKKTYNNLACDSNGVLSVNVVSGGGGGAGDASASNQLTQIQIAEDSNVAIYEQLEVQTDRLLYDLDIIANRLHDISGTVEVSNMISGYSTSAKQDESNAAVCGRLSTLNQVQEDMLLSVDAINAKLNELPIQSARYTIEAASTLAPGITPAYSTPPPGISKEAGYYFKNTGLSQPSQLYYYSYTNTTLQVSGRQFAYQLNDIACGYAVVRLLAVNATAGLTTLAIYTRPTGSGDAAPGYYKSRKVYQIPSTAKLTQGMEVMIYWGVAPSLKLHPGVARIELELALSVGPCVGTEQLAYLTVNTDSAALAGNAEYCLKAAGFQYGGELIMDSVFTGESSSQSSGSDATAANQTLQLNAATNSNLAVCTRLDNSNLALSSHLATISSNIGQLSYSGSNVVVFDKACTDAVNGANNMILSQFTNLNTNLGNGLYTLLETSPVISGGVRIAGSTDGNAYVYDSQCNSTIALNLEQLVTLNGTFADLQSGDSQLHVVLSGADDSVSMMAYNPTTMMPEALTLSSDSGMKALDVHVVNQPSGYATESTLADISELIMSQSGFNRFQVEAQVTDGKLDTIISNMSLTNFNVNNLTKCDTDNVAIPAGVTINGTVPVSGTFYQETQPVSIAGTVPVSGTFYQETQPVSIAGTVPVSGTFYQETQPVSIAGTVPISSGSPLDVHCFGSSDGVVFHHLKTNTNGVLATNAIMETDAHGAITSENVSGTENYNALHTWIKNPVINVNARGYAASESTFVPIAVDEDGKVATTLSGAVNVQNSTGQQLAIKSQQFGSWGNIYNLVTVNPYSPSSAIDVSTWAYFVAYYEDSFVGSHMYPQALRIQYSFDNINWYNIFNTTIYPSSGSGGINTATVYKVDIPGINWLRFYNDTSDILPNVKLTVMGASN